MVCIAAFIILLIVGIVVAILSIFRRDLWKKYIALLKKSFYCFNKRVRLQKCDTNFADDVKTTLTSRIVLKHPKWLKPIGWAIELFSWLIVLITVWSIIEAIKALLALFVFGTCNVSQPAQCALGAEICSIDADEPSNAIEYVGRWFSEWGEIFVNLPDRFQNWSANDYINQPTVYVNFDSTKETALDIFDPGCTVCLTSYRNQLSSGFFDKYNVALMIYPITYGEENTEKFQNSELIAKYFYTAAIVQSEKQEAPLTLQNSYSAKIVDRIFTGVNTDGIIYQNVLQTMNRVEAEQTLKSWLEEFGATKAEIEEIAEKVDSDEVQQTLNTIKETVENRIHAKGIPTGLYDGRKHHGLYKAK